MEMMMIIIIVIIVIFLLWNRVNEIKLYILRVIMNGIDEVERNFGEKYGVW